jgi:hypothetical protein
LRALQIGAGLNFDGVHQRITEFLEFEKYLFLGKLKTNTISLTHLPSISASLPHFYQLRLVVFPSPSLPPLTSLPFSLSASPLVLPFTLHLHSPEDKGEVCIVGSMRVQATDVNSNHSCSFFL